MPTGWTTLPSTESPPVQGLHVELEGASPGGLPSSSALTVTVGTAHSWRGPGLLGWLSLAAATQQVQERQVQGQNLRGGLLAGGHSAMLSWGFCP